MKPKTQSEPEQIISEATGNLISVVAFESDGDMWGAGFLSQDGAFLAFYEDGDLSIEPHTPEIPASYVEPTTKNDTLPKLQPL